jgi:hypothetical protein
MAFIGRQHELEFLSEAYSSSKAQFVILYGRRRIGKSELLLEFSKGRIPLFYTAQQLTKREQLNLFTARLREYGASGAQYVSGHESWEQALRDFAGTATEGRKLLIIDEFPYLAQSDPSLPSTLQVLWDTYLKNLDVMIVLCGSSMSFMENEILAEKNALYGRATGILKLNPMPYDVCARFFPGYTADEQVRAYSILGGVPYYLSLFDPGKSVDENVVACILKKGSALYSEVEFLLRQELRETAVYNSIIQAVAMGSTSLNEISQKVGISSQKVSVYLGNLMELRLVEREFSVGDPLKQMAKTRGGLYRLSDNFFRFWYTYVFPNWSDLEMFDAQGVFDNDVAPDLDRFCSFGFEDICRQWLQEQNRRRGLPFRCESIGRYWHKQVEIDAVGFSRQTPNAARGERLLAAECKYTKEPVGADVLARLKEKTAGFRAGEVAYYLFSRSGFTAELQKIADGDPAVCLVWIDELYA